MHGHYEGKFEVTTTNYAWPFRQEAFGFTPGTAYITVESQDVRFRYGEQPPTVTDGHLMYAGSEKLFNKTVDIVNLKFIAVTGTAIIQYTIKGV